MVTHNRKRYTDESRWFDYLQVTAGALLIALAFNVFFRPNSIAPGGIAGFSIIIERLTDLPPYWVIWSFNLVLLGVCWFLLGATVVKRSVIGAFLVPLFIMLTGNLPTLTDDLLMASIFGGVVTGLGIGVMFRGKGTSGGFGLAAMLIHTKMGLPIGRALLSMDALVLLMGMFVFPVEKVLGAMIAAFVLSRTSQAVLSGLDTSKVAFIISDKADEIKEIVLKDLDLGLTTLEGEGGFTGDGRQILMVVARPGDVFRLKKMIGQYDDQAFLILSNASEVLGHGFKQHVLR